MSTDLNASRKQRSSEKFPHYGADVHCHAIRGWGIRRTLGSGGEMEVTAPERVESPESVESRPSQPEQLAQLALQVANCRDCGLCESRNLTAFGVGDPDADLMFVGEAPGHEEDRRGEPFVGRAGQLLDKIIAALGLGRDQVYIANVLKCRPPGNRDPQPAEIEACRSYLEAHIRLVESRILVALGRPAACWLTGQETSLKRLRGQQHQWQGIPVIATYHPAFLLRQEQYKGHCWQDLQQVIEYLDLTPGAGRS
ncbi:MAG: uracil-DNA glycosylase [Planctomycetota bacterium]